MATTVGRRGAAGVQQSWYGLWDSLGFFIGAGTTAPAAGTAQHARQLYGVKEAAPTIPETETVQITGDDDLLAEIDFASIQSRRFTASLAAEDLALINHIQGTVTRLWGETSVTGLDVSTLQNYNFAVWFQSRAVGLIAPQSGASQWSGLMVHLAQMAWLGRESLTERTAANYRVSITPQRASYEITALTLQDSYAGVCNERFATIGGENPITATAFTGNNSLAIIPVLMQPISVVKTFATVNRVAATVTAVTTGASPSVTLSVAPASGARVEIIYEYDASNC
jgi:hypothetical protein